VFETIRNHQITRIHAYAILSEGAINTLDQAQGDVHDTLALMLPLDSLPAAALNTLQSNQLATTQPNPIEITLNHGVAHWLGADHKHHQIGEAHKPLDFNIVSRLHSELGLLTAFVDAKSGRPKYWAVLKKHDRSDASSCQNE